MDSCSGLAAAAHGQQYWHTDFVSAGWECCMWTALFSASRKRRGMDTHGGNSVEDHQCFFESPRGAHVLWDHRRGPCEGIEGQPIDARQNPPRHRFCHQRHAPTGVGSCGDKGWHRGWRRFLWGHVPTGLWVWSAQGGPRGSAVWCHCLSDAQ